MVTVTATGPALVRTTSSRTPATSRSAALFMSSGVQFLRMMPNLLPEKRPSSSPPRILVRSRFATAPIASSAMSKP